MVHISSIVEFVSGTPQFRIVEALNDDAPVYYFYAQYEIEEDLVGLDIKGAKRKQVKTFDTVSTVSAGDVIFSLLSGKAAIVQAGHSGYLFTQNYVTLVPSDEIDARYLVYMLNENREIKSQLQSGKQGSATFKYSIRQLNNLVFPHLPPKDKQEAIGELYFSQVRLNALRKRASELETILVLAKIRKADPS
ncbi:hypothetical protein [Eggerthella sinensis]|uniref:hypothetical protein n=1 Tax=Eggerthella sinensis TaxID=242230 RepID=UPI00266DD11F|nr:hypothetical protein [Eggerthella sinensis]